MKRTITNHHIAQWVRQTKPIRTLSVIAPLLLLGCSSISTNPSPALAEAQVTSPTHFWFDYPYQPNPGKRFWTAVGQTWIEQYDGGHYSQFKVMERTTVQGVSGTLAVKVTGDPDQTWTGNDADFQVFIPDIGAAEMLFKYRHKMNDAWQEWQSLTEMKGIE